MLTNLQKREFVEKGYLKVSGAIPRLQIEAARRAVNHSIGTVAPGGESLERNMPAHLCSELCDPPVSRWTPSPSNP